VTYQAHGKLNSCISHNERIFPPDILDEEIGEYNRENEDEIDEDGGEFKLGGELYWTSFRETFDEPEREIQE
jgi:hypothetical protein